MEEMAFLIILVIGVVITAKLWAPWIKDQSEDVNIALTERKAERQAELKELDEKISKIIADNDGIIYHLEDISAKLYKSKPGDTK